MKYHIRGPKQFDQFVDDAVDYRRDQECDVALCWTDSVRCLLTVSVRCLDGGWLRTNAAVIHLFEVRGSCMNLLNCCRCQCIDLRCCIRKRSTLVSSPSMSGNWLAWWHFLQCPLNCRLWRLTGCFVKTLAHGDSLPILTNGLHSEPWHCSRLP